MDAYRKIGPEEEIAMGGATQQSFENHVRRDPLFHFFLLPVFGIAVVWSIVHAIRHPLVQAWAFVIFAIAIMILAFKTRLYALKVQSRVIRLEERLRLYQLLSGPTRSRIPELTESQLIAIRFASDAECPALVEQALTKNLSNADLKKLIRQWRGDYWRV